MNISNLFSDEKINTGRQVELDIVKALSIIFMIFLHTFYVASLFMSSFNQNFHFALFSNQFFNEIGILTSHNLFCIALLYGLQSSLTHLPKIFLRYMV